MKRLFAILTAVLLLWVQDATAQNRDSLTIRGFFNNALTSYESFNQLKWLCKNTKGRICGTPQAAAAVEYTRQVMQDMDLDSVWLQPCRVKRWIRGEKEQARIVSSFAGTVDVPVCALGWSAGTGVEGLSSVVVEVKSQAELKILGESKIRGKIVFFNQPMDPTNLATFSSYGQAAWQRTSGPSEAARFGAVGCVIRSLSIETDDFPHTGVTRFEDDAPKIPSVAIPTRAADLLGSLLRKDPQLNFYFRTTCQIMDDVWSANVIGEIRGTDFPGEIITVGGHLDAWDIGEGAHDDGGGCIQAIEMLRLFLAGGVRPRHTIRAVMFMDEEVAQRGGLRYAEEAVAKGEKHIAALESDRGVYQPKAMGLIAKPDQMMKAMTWQPLFDPYNIKLVYGGGGADIGPLKNHYPEILMMGIIPDDQRYFSVHHSPADTFEQVNRREMQMGAAAIAAIIYLIDKYEL